MQESIRRMTVSSIKEVTASTMFAVIVFRFYTLSCNIVTSVLHDRLETFGTFCQIYIHTSPPGKRNTLYFISKDVQIFNRNLP